MRLLHWLVPLTLAGMVSPGWAADDDEEKSNPNDPTYTAIRISAVESEFKNLDRAVNLGFTIGIRIPPLRKYLAAEIDLSSTLIPGENSGAAGGLGGGGGDGGGGVLDPIIGGGGDDNGSSGSGGGKRTRDSDDLRLNSVGVFLTGRSPGKFFGMARVGYRFVQSTIIELEEDDTGSAWGLGFGYRYAEESSVELAYTRYGDLSFMSLVVNY